MSGRDASADLAVLRERYGQTSPFDERPEGARYRGRLADGTHVIVTILAHDLAERLTEPGEFVRALRQANEGRPDAFPRLASVERDASGMIHFAHAAQDAQPIEPGTVKSRELAI